MIKAPVCTHFSLSMQPTSDFSDREKITSLIYFVPVIYSRVLSCLTVYFHKDAGWRQSRIF